MPAIFLALTLLFGAVALAVGSLTEPNAPAPVAAAEVDESRQSMLVDATWLADRLAGDATPVVIDVSDQRVYDQEHIPGAIHIWWQDAMFPHGAQYGMALRVADDPPGLAQYMPEIGARPDDLIVVYDNTSGERAAWIAWWLRAGGFTSTVVLDGGLAAWKGAGLDVSDEPASPRIVDPFGPTWNGQGTIFSTELAGRMGTDPNVIVIDVRTPSQRQDTINDTLPLGRIPGSLTLPDGGPRRADGTYLSPDEAYAWLRPLGLQPYNEIVIYGRFGTDTGQAWLALNLAGYTNVRVLDDGYQGWSADPARPIEPLAQ